MFDLGSTYLGDQWSIGAWDAMRAAAPDRLPHWMQAFPIGDEPSQDLKEYDPEWGRAFWTGTVAASCDHERMLRAVKVPRSEEHTSDSVTNAHLVCRLLLEKKNNRKTLTHNNVTYI